jgi:hypothetical protein
MEISSELLEFWSQNKFSKSENLISVWKNFLLVLDETYFETHFENKEKSYKLGQIEIESYYNKNWYILFLHIQKYRYSFNFIINKSYLISSLQNLPLYFSSNSVKIAASNGHSDDFYVVDVRRRCYNPSYLRMWGTFWQTRWNLWMPFKFVQCRVLLLWSNCSMRLPIGIWTIFFQLYSIGGSG